MKIKSERANINLFNMDCLEAMREMKDNQYDLAIVDPPYGMSRKMDGSTGGGRVMNKWKRAESWDVAPSEEYFTELMRVSKNQIIWGANNFWEFLRNTTNFIFWYKQNPVDNFADGEFAWTSFKKTAKCFNHRCYGAHGQDPLGKIHPTQKPVALYKWLLQNYAEEGDTIIDTHLGSGSIAIACHELGFDLTGYELDKDYFESSINRIEKETAQLQLF